MPSRKPDTTNDQLLDAITDLHKDVGAMSVRHDVLHDEVKHLIHVVGGERTRSGEGPSLVTRVTKLENTSAHAPKPSVSTALAVTQAKEAGATRRKLIDVSRLLLAVAIGGAGGGGTIGALKGCAAPMEEPPAHVTPIEESMHTAPDFDEP